MCVVGNHSSLRVQPVHRYKKRSTRRICRLWNYWRGIAKLLLVGGNHRKYVLYVRERFRCGVVGGEQERVDGVRMQASPSRSVGGSGGPK